MGFASRDILSRQLVMSNGSPDADRHVILETPPLSFPDA